MRPWLSLALLLSLQGCSGQTTGDLPRRDTEIDRAAGRAKTATYCGNIGYLDLGSAVDGSAYFFDRRTGKIISTCGGACEFDPENRCKRECPPPAWTCGPLK